MAIYQADEYYTFRIMHMLRLETTPHVSLLSNHQNKQLSYLGTKVDTGQKGHANAISQVCKHKNIASKTESTT
jgi:hypothetical protein